MESDHKQRHSCSLSARRKAIIAGNRWVSQIKTELLPHSAASALSAAPIASSSPQRKLQEICAQRERDRLHRQKIAKHGRSCARQTRRYLTRAIRESVRHGTVGSRDSTRTPMKAAERRAVPRVGGDEREKDLVGCFQQRFGRKRSGASRLRQLLSRVWS